MYRHQCSDVPVPIGLGCHRGIGFWLFHLRPCGHSGAPPGILGIWHPGNLAFWERSILETSVMIPATSTTQRRTWLLNN